MEEKQAVESDKVYVLSISDPERDGQIASIVVNSSDDEMVYHSRLARYLANQCDRLIPHFYRQWEATTRATLQTLVLRLKQGLKPSEEPVLRAYMTQSYSQLLASAQLKRILVNGTHVVATFGLQGIEDPLFTTDLMIPFSNLQIAQDIKNTECDPAFSLAA